MAQRTVHYALALQLADELPPSLRDRFLLGSLLPDAYPSPDLRERTHYVRYTASGGRYFDFEAFRAAYGEKLATDGLYLGYYAHLAEDACYRRRFYGSGVIRVDSPEDIADLHRDYHLLNGALVRRWGLKDCPGEAPDLSAEPLSELCRFDAAGLLRALRDDLQEDLRGETRFLHPADVNDYMEEAMALLQSELPCVMRGRSLLRAADFAWKKPE